MILTFIRTTLLHFEVTTQQLQQSASYPDHAER